MTSLWYLERVPGAALFACFTGLACHHTPAKSNSEVSSAASTVSLNSINNIDRYIYTCVRMRNMETKPTDCKQLVVADTFLPALEERRHVRRI
jgi:hypothetical protein